jgi:5-methylcytosine-specific restriction endonuclease McrBC GTP-binding regulatory subunit McrB
MNTSDRSIASIDIALRRRFTFIPMRPKDTLVQDKFGIRLHDIFTTINTKIEILLDEDHKIGHSYFMNKKCTSLETLKQTWFYEIMPLINEYFYGDWENLRFILKDFVKEIPDAKSILGELSKNFDGDKFYKFTTIEDFSNDQYFITTMNNLIKNN